MLSFRGEVTWPLLPYLNLKEVVQVTEVTWKSWKRGARGRETNLATFEHAISFSDLRLSLVMEIMNGFSFKTMYGSEIIK